MVLFVENRFVCEVICFCLSRCFEAEGSRYTVKGKWYSSCILRKQAIECLYSLMN